jgi:hypothetical protein
MKKNIEATVGGFVFSATVPAFIAATFYPLTDGFIGYIISFIYAYFFSHLGAGFFGLPIFLAAEKLRLLRWWTAVFGGALCALLINVFLHFGPPSLHELQIFIPTGALTGLTFWLIRSKMLAHFNLSSESDDSLKP